MEIRRGVWISMNDFLKAVLKQEMAEMDRMEAESFHNPRSSFYKELLMDQPKQSIETHVINNGQVIPR